MKTRYLIVVFMCIAFNASGQNKSYLDTIKISIDNRIFISIATFNYRDLTKENTFFEDISAFQSSISKAKEGTPVYNTYKIEYKPGKSLVIKEGENKKSYIIKENTVEPNRSTSECIINGDDYKMYIQFAEIDDLINTDLKSKVKQTFQKMPARKRTSGIYNFEVKDTSYIHHRELDQKTGSLDVLEIKIGAGAGIIKNQPLNNITAIWGVKLPRNGILKFNVYLSTRSYITFDANNKIQFNNFVNFGFRQNFSNVVGRQNWMGFEIGRIIRNDANLFGKDAWVFGTVKEFGKLSLSTEIYFYDRFKKYFPGLRIEFDF